MRTRPPRAASGCQACSRRYWPGARPYSRLNALAKANSDVYPACWATERQRLLDAGAAAVVVTDGSDLVREVKAITGGRGAEVVFDAVGGPGFRTLGEAAHAGRLVIYGWLSARPVELPMNWPLTVHGYAVALQTTNTAEGKRRSEHFIASGLRSGALRPVTGEVFEGLDRIGDAHRLMESNAHTGKLLVTVRH